MALTKDTNNYNIHAGLPDKPDSSVYPPASIKALFDKAANEIQTYINGTLTEELDAGFALKSELAATVLGQIGDGTITEAKMASDMKKDVAGGVASYNDLTDIAYDVYRLRLQAYYDGKTPLTKGLIVDGFASLSSPSDSSVTTAPIEVSNKIIDMSAPTIEQKVHDHTYIAFKQTFTPTKRCILNSVTVYAETTSTPSGQLICYLRSGVNGAILATSSNSVTPATGYITFSFSSIVLSAQTEYCFHVTRINADTAADETNESSLSFWVSYYATFSGGLYSESGSSTSYDAYFTTGLSEPASVVYQTLEQAAGLSFTEAVMYLSVQKSGTSSFTPSIDAYTDSPTGTYTPMTQDTSYARDVGDGYVEYKYILSLSAAKTKAKVRIDFSNTSGTLKIRELGVLCLA